MLKRLKNNKEELKAVKKDAYQYFGHLFLIIIVSLFIWYILLFIFNNIIPSGNNILAAFVLLVLLFIFFILCVVLNTCFFKKNNKPANPCIHYVLKFIDFGLLVFILAIVPIISEARALRSSYALESSDFSKGTVNQILIQYKKEVDEINPQDQLVMHIQKITQKEKKERKEKLGYQLNWYVWATFIGCITRAYGSRNYYVKGKAEIEIQGELTKIYDEEEVKNPKVEIKGSEGKVFFQWYERREDIAGNIIWDEMMKKPINAGVYGVKAVLEETVKYERAESKFKDFKIEKASSTIEVQDNLNKVYDGEAVEDPTDIEKTGSSGAVTYEWYEKEVARSGEETWKLLEKAPQDVGDYKVKANLEAGQNYFSAEVEKEFAITEK